MAYVVGVDGGGSKTHALVLDGQGQALGFGSSGCGNHQEHGLELAAAEIKCAFYAALDQAALTTQDISAGYFCLAGADLDEDYRMLAAAMEALNLAQKVIVKNDTMAALRASITRSWGVTVICGSGFNAAGRSPEGKEIVLPGLGFISGDWGGGGQLGHEMIRLVMRAWDGRGEKTLLTALVLNHLRVPTEEALIEELYFERIAYRELLHLVPLLFEAAEAGDPPARKLITLLGEEVAVSANALIKRLAMQDLAVEVGLAGGVFRGKGTLLVETVTSNVHRVAPKAVIRKNRYEPVVGAALLALESTGGVVDEAVYCSLDMALGGRLKM